MLLVDLIGEGEAVLRQDNGIEKSLNFVVAVALLIFPIAARAVYPAVFREVFPLGLRQAETDASSNKWWSLLFLGMFAIVCMGLGFTEIGLNRSYSSPVLMNMVIILTLFSLWVFILFAVNAIMFQRSEMFLNHLQDVLRFISIMGIGFYLVILIQWFTESHLHIIFLNSVIVLLGLSLVWRLLRLTFRYVDQTRRGYVFIFLYLCAVEISPFLILGKLLVNQS